MRTLESRRQAAGGCEAHRYLGSPGCPTLPCSPMWREGDHSPCLLCRCRKVELESRPGLKVSGVKLNRENERPTRPSTCRNRNGYTICCCRGEEARAVWRSHEAWTQLVTLVAIFPLGLELGNTPVFFESHFICFLEMLPCSKRPGSPAKPALGLRPVSGWSWVRLTSHTAALTSQRGGSLCGQASLFGDPAKAAHCAEGETGCGEAHILHPPAVRTRHGTEDGPVLGAGSVWQSPQSPQVLQ